MATIIAKNTQHTGTTASVSFVHGVGRTDDPKRIKWFKDHGYEVIENGQAVEPEDADYSDDEEVDETEEKHEADLGDMTVPQLKEYAAVHNISLIGKNTKLEIIASIEAQKG